MPSRPCLVSKEELHQEIEHLDAHDRVKMVAHLLIEVGQVTHVECTYVNCKMVTRAFGGSRMQSVAVDHIVSRRNGGSNRPENLQLIHLGCNSRKARFEDAGVPIAEFMARAREANHNHSEFMKAQWADPEIRAQRLATMKSRRKGDTAPMPC